MSSPTESRSPSLAAVGRVVVEWPAIAVTVVMMVHITANALSRTFFNAPLPHTLEISQYWYLPIAALLGFIAAQIRGQHIAADLLYSHLPTASKRIVLAVMLALSALVCASFAYYGLLEALHAYSIGLTAGISTVPGWPPLFLVPIALGSLTVQLFFAAVGALRGEGVDEPAETFDDAEAVL